MYQRQTSQEQAQQATREQNGVGFNGCDAKFLTDVAQKSVRCDGLTEGQARAVAKCLRKYRGQISSIIGATIAQGAGQATQVAAAPAPVAAPKATAKKLYQPGKVLLPSLDNHDAPLRTRKRPTRAQIESATIHGRSAANAWLDAQDARFVKMMTAFDAETLTLGLT